MEQETTDLRELVQRQQVTIRELTEVLNGFRQDGSSFDDEACFCGKPEAHTSQCARARSVLLNRE